MLSLGEQGKVSQRAPHVPRRDKRGEEVNNCASPESDKKSEWGHRCLSRLRFLRSLGPAPSDSFSARILSACLACSVRPGGVGRLRRSSSSPSPTARSSL